MNQVCGSGLKAVALAAQAIETGNAEMVVAGGMESMSNAPYLLPQARGGYRMGNGALVDAMIHDGLWEAYKGFHMGVGAEMIAAKYGITREEQDAFAAESHSRAAAATAQGVFREEILPVEIPAAKKGAAASVFSVDEPIRPETTVEVLARLETGVSGRWNSDGGQLAGGERRRRGAGGDQQRAGAATGAEAAGGDPGAGDERRSAGVVWAGAD